MSIEWSSFFAKVFGARVGDPASQVPEGARWEGDRAYFGPSTFIIEDGRIRKIWIRREHLAGVPIHHVDDIVRLLGPPAGIERTLGWIVHHHPEANLSVGWEAGEDRLEHIALGPVDWEPRVFRAGDVLREWLAAQHVVHKAVEPTGGSEKVRWARMTALLRAFELGSMGDFMEGKFLDGKDRDRYPLTAAALRKHAPESLRPRPDSLSRFFWWLLRWREQAQSLLRLNSGWLEAGHEGIFAALEVTGHASLGVAESLTEIDALLCEMISPDRSIPERELAGWPDVDLNQLLMDEEL